MLLDRTTLGVELSDTGQALLIEARRTLAAADTARDAVAAVQGGIRDTLRIRIMHSLVLIDLAALITRYQALAPQVQLVSTGAAGGSVELARVVTDGRLDLAFVALPDDHPTESPVHRLAVEDQILACPPEHRRARRPLIELTELDGERFLVEVADLPLAGELVRAGPGPGISGAVDVIRTTPTRPAPGMTRPDLCRFVATPEPIRRPAAH